MMYFVKHHKMRTLITLVCISLILDDFIALASTTSNVEMKGSESGTVCTQCINSSMPMELISKSLVKPTAAFVTCNNFYRRATKSNWGDSQKGGSGIGISQAGIQGNVLKLVADANLWATFWAQGQIGDSFIMDGRTTDYGITGYCAYTGQLAFMAGLGKEAFNVDLVVFDVTNDVEIARKHIDSASVDNIGGPVNVNSAKKSYIEIKLYKGRQYRIYFDSKVEAASWDAPLALSDFSSNQNWGVTFGYTEVKALETPMVGDLNCDGKVSLDEVIQLINGWSNGLVSLHDVVEAINNWAKSP
jgi:hypothetical protein